MTGLEIGFIALAGFILLMFLGIPVPFAMIITATVGILIMSGPVSASQILVAELYNTFTNYALTVGPMFGLMGYLASYSGVGDKLFVSINSMFGHRKCGLANAVQVAGAGFGAVCGSPPAATAMFSELAYPEMRARGYQPEIAAGTIIAASGLSIIIPPSNNFILYGLITETSIGQLFLAGIIPGIIVMVLNCCGILLMGKLRPHWIGGVSERVAWAERIRSFKNGGLIVIAIVFIISMGGMFAGFFTPTEAGAVGAFGLFVITLVTKQMNWTRFKNALFAGVRLQAMVFMLLACANVFGKMLAISKIPMTIGKYVDAVDASPWVIVTVILVIYFSLGLFCEQLSLMLITMPIFFPIVVTVLGYSPVWWGVIVTLIVCIGSLTPPVGVGVFIGKGCIAWDNEATISRLYSGIWIFVITLVAAVALFLAFPVIVTGLPDVVYGR